MCSFYLMLFNKPLQCFLFIRQTAMETQTLFCFSQPLQQDMNCGVELLCLQTEDTYRSGLKQVYPPSDEC